jgi:hypothetical protein
LKFAILNEVLSEDYYYNKINELEK